MVIVKPMQFTSIRAVPFVSTGAKRAIKVENKGESAITTIPQKTKKAIVRELELLKRKNGDSRQHRQDKNNAKVATGFA